MVREPTIGNPLFVRIPITIRPDPAGTVILLTTRTPFAVCLPTRIALRPNTHAVPNLYPGTSVRSDTDGLADDFVPDAAGVNRFALEANSSVPITLHRIGGFSETKNKKRKSEEEEEKTIHPTTPQNMQIGRANPTALDRNIHIRLFPFFNPEPGIPQRFPRPVGHPPLEHIPVINIIPALRSRDGFFLLAAHAAIVTGIVTTSARRRRMEMNE